MAQFDDERRRYLARRYRRETKSRRYVHTHIAGVIARVFEESGRDAAIAFADTSHRHGLRAEEFAPLNFHLEQLERLCAEYSAYGGRVDFANLEPPSDIALQDALIKAEDQAFEKAFQALMTPAPLGLREAYQHAAVRHGAPAKSERRVLIDWIDFLYDEFAKCTKRISSELEGVPRRKRKATRDRLARRFSPGLTQRVIEATAARSLDQNDDRNRLQALVTELLSNPRIDERGASLRILELLSGHSLGYLRKKLR